MNSQFKAALFSQNNGFYDAIQGNSAAEKEARMNVYRNNIFVSLMDALADIFPVTQALVGEDFFRALAKEYILIKPPKSPVISDYGDEFADFIRHFEAAKSLPFLADLATLEYTLLAITHAAEQQTLDHQQISATFNQTSDPTQLLLQLPETTQILVSPYAIGSIYQSHQNQDTSKLSHIKTTNSEHLLLAKSHIYAKLYMINQAEASFINSLLQAKPLAEAVPDDADFDLATSLAKLIEWKLITHISQATA